MKVFGVATKDAQGNARNLVDVLGEVSAATANIGTGDRAEAFNEVFGLLGITSASAIGKTVTDTRQLLAELQNSGGIVAGVVGVGAAFIGIGSAAGVAAFAVGGLASMFSLVGTAIGVLVTMR